LSSSAPAVSVAIRAHRERWLGEAIDSVLDQDFEDLELVVYDDHGGLEEIAHRRGDARVRYRRAGDDGGPAGRFAAAAALCRGRFLAMLDDDDRYAPGFLARLVAALEDDPAAGVAFCQVSYLTPRGLRTPLDERAGGVRPEIPAEVMAFRAWIPPSTMLMRREAWESVAALGPVPPAIAPDAWVHVRSAELGWHHVLVDAPLAQRRWHADQISQSGLENARLLVGTWSELASGNPELERLRLAVLARKRIRLAVYLLAEGDADGAREQLAQSAGAAPGWRALGVLVRLAASVAALGRPVARLAIALRGRMAGRGTPPAVIGMRR